jgi:pimeloyl-ACP methyl ester carboxylesterase
MGKSDKPTSRYSTSELAKDVVDLLVHVGWLNQDLSLSDPSNRLNIVGVSMGGMIAQELGLALPTHTINALFLISTWPRVVRTVPFIENLRQRINMFIPRDIDVQLSGVCERLFADEFLRQPDTEGDEPYGPGGPNFPTKRDRYCAGEMEKRNDKEGYTRKGFILQAIAAGWHHKSPEQIQQMRDHVGKGRIAVAHGTLDKMITYNHGELLRDEIGESVEWRSYDNVGHVIMWEREDSFNQWVAEFIEKCKQIDN